jgi:ABC-2 type transport system permease protein
VDHDRSATSRGLVDRILATGLFTVAGTSSSMEVAEAALLDRSAAVVLHLPAEFEEGLARTGEAPVQLVYDAQDGAAAGILNAYLTGIIQRYAAELGTRMAVSAPTPGAGPSGRAGVEVRHQGWYNPEFIYSDYMVPGILVLLVTIVSLAIMSMNIVREKEIGTLEQINVTPVTRGQFIAGKLLPFWIIALVDLALGLVVARLVFQIPLEGPLAVIVVGALVYLFVTLGIGLWISTVVETQQQAMFISFTVNMVFLLMSGLFTPVASMPGWARIVAELSPVKHFIEVMRAVLLKGAGFAETALPLAILAGMGAVVFTLAVRQHSKTTA